MKGWNMKAVFVLCFYGCLCVISQGSFQDIQIFCFFPAEESWWKQ